MEEQPAHRLHGLATTVGLEPDGRIVRRPTRSLLLDGGGAVPEG